MRTVARETLFKILFSNEFCSEQNNELKTALYKADKLSEDDIAYCDRVLALCGEHSAEFLSLLDKYSLSFPEKRIFPADRAILLIGIAEILYCEDIPVKVTLNEAANIAGKYSSAKSASYISGVLSAVAENKNV